MQRYFSKEKINNEFILNEGDLYHIKTVMRMKSMDRVEVVYDGCVYESIINYDKDIHVIMDKKMESSFLKMPYVVLILPLLKEQKLDIILQKATELGVNEILFTNMSRSIIKLTDDKLESKLERWSRICKEASEQSKRVDIPNLTFISNFKGLKDLEGVKIICSTKNPDKTIKNALKNVSYCDKINLVIGPEGGLSPEEEDYLINNGFDPVTFGSRILRAETVPLYLLSIINYEFME